MVLKFVSAEIQGINLIDPVVNTEERGYFGKEVPIPVKPRVEKSSVKALKDGLRTLQIILFFFPLFTRIRFFGGIGLVVILAGFIYGLIVALTKHQGIPILATVLILPGCSPFSLA